MTKLARAPNVIVPFEEDETGPAMKELTVPQRNFVMHYAASGGENATEAARRAGYGTNADTQAVIASNMLRQPRILAALRELADQRLRGGAILAASVLVQIAQNPLHRDQYKAAVELLNRAGLVVEGVSRVIVEDHRTVEEIERRIIDLSDRLGVDYKRLLGTVQAQDVDFTEVDEGGLEAVVSGIHNAGDEWQDGQREFDALLERSE